MLYSVTLKRVLPALAILFTFSSFIAPSSNLEEDVLYYSNQFRKSKGKGALLMKSDLNSIARKHSEDMAKGRVAFGHDGFNRRYSELKQLYKSCTAAENVAFGVKTGREVVRMWQNSSGHRANLLGNYKYIGIGTARDGRGRIYYTQIFVR